MKYLRSAILYLTCAFSVPDALYAQQDDEFFGKVTRMQPIRPEIEPGRVFVGNDQGVLNELRRLIAQSDEETDAIITQMQATGIDNLPPPFLLEYSRRKYMRKDEDWARWYMIGMQRMMFDRLVCVDRSAQQFQTVIVLEFSGFTEFKTDLSKYMQEHQMVMMGDMLDKGEFFSSNVSAWWICSHGAGHFAAAVSGKSLTLKDWFVGEKKRDEIRKTGETQMRTAVKRSFAN